MCETKRREKRTRAGRCDRAPPSNVVALRRKLRTKQYFHRSRLFVLFLTSLGAIVFVGIRRADRRGALIMKGPRGQIGKTSR